MDPIALYRRAWDALKPNLMGWVVFYGVFFFVSLVTGGLGIVLMPNAHRELRDARAEARGPDISRLFRFDRIGNDVVNGVIFIGATWLGGMAAGIGASIAAVLLEMLMPLAAEDRYSPVDNAKLSVHYVLKNLGEAGTVFLIASALAFLGVFTFCLAFPVILPLIGMATQIYYEDKKAEMDEMAKGMGLLTVGGDR